MSDDPRPLHPVYGVPIQRCPPAYCAPVEAAPPLTVPSYQHVPTYHQQKCVEAGRKSGRVRRRNSRKG